MTFEELRTEAKNQGYKYALKTAWNNMIIRFGTKS